MRGISCAAGVRPRAAVVRCLLLIALLLCAAPASATQLPDWDVTGTWEVTVTGTNLTLLDGTHTFVYVEQGNSVLVVENGITYLGKAYEDVLQFTTWVEIQDINPFYNLDCTSDTAMTGYVSVRDEDGILRTGVANAVRVSTAIEVPEADLDYLDCYLPHITAGDPFWENYLEVFNTDNGQTPAEFRLILRGEDGQIIFDDVFEVGPLGHLALTLSEIAPEATCGTFRPMNRGLAAYVDYQSTGGGYARFDVSEITARKLTFDLASQDDSSWRGIAIMNAGDAVADVEVIATQEGTVRGRTLVSIPVGTRVVKTLAEWFPLVAEDQVDALVVVSEASSLTGMSIEGNSDASRVVTHTPRSGLSYVQP